MLPNKCKSFPRGSDTVNVKDYSDEIANALRSELGPNASKKLGQWTGASRRCTENWLNGKNLPSSAHLIVLMKHSDEVMKTCLNLASRPQLNMAIGLLEQLDLMESFAVHQKSLLLASS